MTAACLAVVGLLGVAFYLIRLNAQKETAWAKERNLLISRIQTPHLAPSLAFEPAADEPQGPPKKMYAGFDNDEEFHQAALEHEALT